MSTMLPLRTFWLLLALVGAMPFSGAASAAAVTGALVLHEPPHFDGDASIVSAAGGVDIAPDGRPSTGVTLEWARAEGWLHTRQWLVTAGFNTSYRDPYSERLDLPPAGLVSIECHPGCQLLVFSTGEGNVTLDAAVDGPVARADDVVAYWAVSRGGQNGTFLHEFPAGSLQWGRGTSDPAQNGTAAASGSLMLFARDARLEFATGEGRRVIDLKDEREPLVSPAGSVAMEVISRFLVLELEDGLLAAPIENVRVTTPSANATLAGSLLAPEASGTVLVDGEPHSIERGRIQLAGLVRLALDGAPAEARPALLDPSPSATSATVSADAAEVWINGRLVKSAPPPPTASAPLLAILVALLLLAMRFAVLPLYSRISRDRVFSNANRRALWRALQERPGQTVTELSRASGLARVVVRHHLAMLASHALVTSRPHGRRHHYFPMGQLLDEHALALRESLADPTRLRVAAALASAPAPATQTALARASGISPRLVSYHLARLEQCGLVAAEGAWRRTYQPTRLLHDMLDQPSERSRTETV